jgi:hypothetical protein
MDSSLSSDNEYFDIDSYSENKKTRKALNSKNFRAKKKNNHLINLHDNILNYSISNNQEQFETSFDSNSQNLNDSSNSSSFENSGSS